MWFAQLPPGPIIEPFAGTRQLPALVRAAGFEADWRCYDIDPALEGVVHRDTLADFPRGFGATITNPPYLSLHFARRKGVAVDPASFGGFPSLYLKAIAEALARCSHVAMIVPESFLTSGYFRERLEHLISLPFEMFADTEMPTALALWGRDDSKDFTVWRANRRLGTYAELAIDLLLPPCHERIQFNQRHGQIGLKAADNTRGPSIGFCGPAEIPAERVKPSARLVTRIRVAKLADPAALITAANRRLAVWRAATQDVLLTAFKGTRADGQFRRRLDYLSARAILASSLCEIESHDHA